ncbi:MAG: ABC transporter ATP-binding protein [Thermomicrobiales bacterium]
MAEVVLTDVVKSYGTVLAVDNVSLTMEDGEFVTLVGPSGCGKTTTLNLIAGLLDITSGTIEIGGRVINDLDPKDRDIAMVFQNYALYPHKSVYENLAFPLKMRGEKKDEIERKVRAAAESLGIKELLDRRPRELSGGQQQRVALGRAVVRNPQVFLMDEPLSNLDAKLRVQTRAEIKRLHRDLNATVVYVTHDQLEAMTMSDRVAVMGGGTVHQYGTPLEVFDTPADLFVASFIGSPAMNILRGTLQQDGAPLVRVGSSRWPLSQRLYAAAQAMNAGPEVAYGIRHRDLAISRSEAPESVHGIVYAVEPTGDITFVHVRVGSDQIIASVEPDVMFAPDEDVWLAPDLNRLHFFDGVTGLAIRDKITSSGQVARASFASEAMAVEDVPISVDAPSVMGGA